MTDLQDAPLTTDRLSELLELAIHEHRLAPGTKLGEDELGEIYGVSRTIVRAALQSLAHQRLVELRRNKGAFVAQPKIKEAREVFEARALLEPRTAHSAALRITDAQIAALQAHIDAEHEAIHKGDHGRALYLSGQFHIEIAKIADQETIAAFIQQLISRSSLIIALYWQRRSALCESNAHHALMKAFIARDGDRAQELMNSHLVDLMTSLDLRNITATPTTLRDALVGS
ncbi:GntR family transcriptional regulator (plasmid) [Marivivens sp. LCG002]|uniref:GntR family transcriptional regulator n=1 Tax=Marivivens sp. LCG002 TaxID=3051171 RepID=UPI0025570B88|nr:GntR family transcriptional regulator [Marivivens sp. LCG002]WIV52438.1 GntR family transcriptional regulator [Marivivens sp. LCG002]